MLVAQHLQRLRAVHPQQVDASAAPQLPGILHRLVHQLAQLQRLGMEHRVVRLQPGQVDDLRHQLTQPDALGVHPAGEVEHGVGVVGGLLHGLAEQLDGPDRGLQLVAHVRDEVAPGLVDAQQRGAVLHQHHQRLVAERRDPHVQIEGGRAGAAHHFGVEDTRLAATA